VRVSHELREAASEALLAAAKEEESPRLTGWLATPPTKTTAFLLQLENGGRMTRTNAATVLTALEAALGADYELVRAWRLQAVLGPSAVAAEGALALPRTAGLRGGMPSKGVAAKRGGSGGGASGRKKARRGIGRMRGFDVSSDDESPSDGRVAAALPKAQQLAAVAGSSTAPTGANDGLAEAGGEPDEDSTVSGADFRAEVERLVAENETLKAESSAAATAANAKIEQLKTNIEALTAEKRARQSVEATLPDDRCFTFAEQYVLQPCDESLVGLVGEKIPDSQIVRVALPRHSLILHHADRGYVSDLGSLLQKLVTSVRGAVSAVRVEVDEPVLPSPCRARAAEPTRSVSGQQL
jgi:hypothetical protein